MKHKTRQGRTTKNSDVVVPFWIAETFFEKPKFLSLCKLFEKNVYNFQRELKLIQFLFGIPGNTCFRIIYADKHINTKKNVCVFFTEITHSR